MNEKWVVTIKTSLPGTCRKMSDLKTETGVFGDYETARAALREKLKAVVSDENRMFDSDGTLSLFKEYADKYFPEDDIEITASAKAERAFIEGLKRIINGEKTDYNGFEGKFWDGNITVCFENGYFEVSSDEGNENFEIYPRILTNMHDMSDAKDYCLYIEDMFDSEKYPSLLMADLKRCND